MKALAPNSMIQNRYLVVQPIGKGGMGEVYLAVDQRLGSAVALKRTFFTEDNTLAAAFEREARILARLRHPVLPKVIDHFVENADQYLVMEHISGDDLSKRLENARKPFPLSWVVFWADQLLDALSYLHSHEPPIIHRDIKPQNLKLTDDNHIVLLDFGLSKDFDTKATSNPMNSASVAGYSPHFASMEQIRGTGTDARSDIFSLAATLYQLLANSVPLDALARADGLLSGKPDPIVPLHQLNPEVTPAVSEVILKGAALRQEDRFATAGEMQKALRRAYDRGKRDSDVPDTPLPTAAAASTQAKDSVPSEDVTRALSDPGKVTHHDTIPITEQPAVEIPKQSDVKTEIFTTEEILEVETQIAANPPTAEAEPTVQSSPPVGAAAAVGSASAVPPNMQAAKTSAAAGAKQNGNSKSNMGFVIGGLIGLAILAAIGAGGGYYLYSTGAAAIPAPSPAPSVEPPAAPLTSESKQDPNPVSGNTGVADSNSSASNSPDREPTPDDPGQTSTRGATRSQPVKAPQAPTVKATPKAKPKDDRTVIIQ